MAPATASTHRPLLSSQHRLEPSFPLIGILPTRQRRRFSVGLSGRQPSKDRKKPMHLCRFLRLTNFPGQCHEISLGMLFLHNEGVYHGDLKPVCFLTYSLANAWLIYTQTNVLIDDAKQARITDFGLSKFRTSQSSRTTVASTRQESMKTPAGTRVFMSPERLQGASLTRETDVYAFAMSVYQVCQISFLSDVELTGMCQHR